MTSEMLFTMMVVVGVLVALASNRVPAEIAMMGALVTVLVGGVITTDQALAGFSNSGMMTVAVLYVVAAALRDTGAIYWLAHKMLGHPKSVVRSQMRLILPTSVLSAFLNNTTVVAIMIPAVQEWAQRLKISPSQLLLPLSYAAILGGTCTLIGTSTNLVVDGLMQSRGIPGLHILDLAWVGVPLLMAGTVFLFLFGRKLLPIREGLVEQLENAREYHVEMMIPSGSPLHNKSIQEAGLRNLHHGYLTDVQRGEKLFTAVSPELQLQEGDELSFIGAPACARELQRVNGLVPVHGGAHKLELNHHQRCLVEVVIGLGFPGLNQTVKEVQFRSRYQAAILSISRGGRRMPGKVGDMALKAGDTLLLETSESFVEQYQHRRDFMLVSPLRDSTPPNFSKAPLATGILALMVVVNVLGFMSVLEVALVASGLLLATGCVTTNRARMNVSVNLPVLVVIGAAFGLGTALEMSGAATWIVGLLLSGGIESPWLALLLVYIVTSLFTEVITNNAAAVLLFPIAIGVAEQLGANPIPFIIAVMFGASASFLTPLGYQTNLMVMGPGGYRFTDYLRIGGPMAILTTLVTTALIPLIWPF